MKTRHWHTILLAISVLVLSCAKEVSQEELIKGAVQLKLEQWESVQMEECRDRIFTKAEDYVDSLLLATSLETKLDTIPKPIKPGKPEKPVFKAKPDSVIVDPIYHQQQ